MTYFYQVRLFSNSPHQLIIPFIICLLFLQLGSIQAQTRGGNQAIVEPLIEEKFEGLIYLDYKREPKIMAFIDLLGQSLKGKNHGIFESTYKFNEETIQKWVYQYVDDKSAYKTEDFNFAFDKVRDITSQGFTNIKALCGFNYTIDEVLSFKPEFADPNKKSHLVRLGLKISSGELKETQLLVITFGYIEGEFLIFNSEKKTL